MLDMFLGTIKDIALNSGFANITGGQALMLIVACVLLYLAIVKKFEPLLLLPIAFGMLLANIPVAGLSAHNEGSLIYYIYQGVKMGIYPPLIFLGIGTMTDFGPLIANPKSFILGAAAQLGIFLTFFMALRPVHPAGGGFDRHYRRRGRPDRHLYHQQAGPPPARAHRGGGLFLHGAGPGHPAPHHEAAHHQEGALDRDGAAAPGHPA